MNRIPIKLLLIIFFAGAGLGLTGCVGAVPTQSHPSPPKSLPKAKTQSQPPKPAVPPSEAQQSVLPEKQTEAEERPGTRAAASLQMTEQGRKLLEQNKVDEAIKVLERAVSLNPSNGRNYYYLAEAWLAKANLPQAKECNYLAGIYLQGNPDWMLKVEEQKNRIK